MTRRTTTNGTPVTDQQLLSSRALVLSFATRPSNEVHDLSPKLLSEVRAQFPGAVRSIYLDTSAHGLMPSSAREAVGRYIEDCINEGGTKATMRDTLDRVRTKFARLIGASPDEIAIVKNVSEG